MVIFRGEARRDKQELVSLSNTCGVVFSASLLFDSNRHLAQKLSMQKGEGETEPAGLRPAGIFETTNKDHGHVIRMSAPCFSLWMSPAGLGPAGI